MDLRPTGDRAARRAPGARRGRHPCCAASIWPSRRARRIALVGRSGAGKSTLLKLDQPPARCPDRGDVLVEGRDTREWDPFALRRRIGYVLQEVGLFPHMTVARQRRGRAAAARLGRGADRRARRRAADARRARRRRRIARPLARRAVGRAASARRRRARARRRSAGAADGRAVRRARSGDARRAAREFRRIQAQVRKTVIIVTHDMGEAFALADPRRRARRRRASRRSTRRASSRASTDPRVRPLLEPLFEAGALAGSRA